MGKEVKKDLHFAGAGTPLHGQYALPHATPPYPWYPGDYANQAYGLFPPYAHATPNNTGYAGAWYVSSGAAAPPSAIPYWGVYAGCTGVSGINQPRVELGTSYIFPDTACVEIAEVDEGRGYSKHYKSFFSDGAVMGKVFRKYAAPETMTVKEMIEKLGGNPSKTYLCEAIETGNGFGYAYPGQQSWVRGQTIFGSGEDGKTKLSGLGWTQGRDGTGQPKAKLVMGKGKKKSKD